jgi:hypothetical protein
VPLSTSDKKFGVGADWSLVGGPRNTEPLVLGTGLRCAKGRQNNFELCPRVKIHRKKGGEETLSTNTQILPQL